MTAPRPAPFGRPTWADDIVSPAFDVLAPARQTVPVVFASPHSGDYYPASFRAASRLDPTALRRSEDAFMDELYKSAPDLGAPLIRARFPRAYVDPNREAWELDPEMFTGALPDTANTTSPRIAAGLGTIAKVVTNGENIYAGKLSVEEALWRIETYYRPYHAALKGLLDATYARFGCVLLIDCHSMPSIGGPMDRDPGLNRVDMVLGDAHGLACTPRITNRVKVALKNLGYRVLHNNPYAGGFTTRHYGQPKRHRHALQIEVNRALYMNEDAITKNDTFTTLQTDISRLIEAIVAIGPKVLQEP
ncbi:N-formylglutamate amidohydrolase [Varunaivibrio sulfuroxidans]|uniref:N-formylglutamate amidohydrolase n=1 Tax=Varunaivibrio sulfuroxidans TaxID=1773489 RepID=A0A4R3J7P6_9PROT|nr:N-formylglutamate amidohydrolase [Varunaivibrio sulfuroxidans]TCS60933.1 N-formylglutamate amidohydrolase [Varunaivibrio sulfuroxidans]WES31659.1 N-formylglutamate amidohydrolase [Varunaivibrio sulfuroxidans]